MHSHERLLVIGRFFWVKNATRIIYLADYLKFGHFGARLYGLFVGNDSMNCTKF